MTTFERWFWILALATSIVAGLAIHALRSDSSQPVSTAHVRDSVAIADAAREARYDSFAAAIALAQADTLGAILRDRARRPPLRIVRTDTVRDTIRMAGDTGSPELCEVVLSCHDARALALRDSALVMTSDSLRGALAIQAATIDSVVAACRPPSPWKGHGIAFGAGFATGLAVCVVAR